MLDDWKIIAIDHVQLAMPRGAEETARNFYQGILGIPERRKPENLAKRGGCWFETDTVRIHLGVEDDFRPAKKAHPAIRILNLAGLAARLAANGIEPRAEEPLPGYSRFYVDDPFGNRLEFLEPDHLKP